MRPVTKGAAPRVYARHEEAQPDLIAVIGRFCSYCGRFIPEGINVEHKRPKEEYPLEKLAWSNFLLACSNCNSCKGHRELKLGDFVWPDTDNTMRAFRHLPGGIVRKNPHLPKKLRRKASRTIYLVGLDRVPGSFRAPSDRDFRWEDRRREWDKATLAKVQLAAHDTPRQREFIVVSAQNGIFPIWWTVFAGDVDMRRRLRFAFKGTTANCFDLDENLLERPGGQL